MCVFNSALEKMQNFVEDNFIFEPMQLFHSVLNVKSLILFFSGIFFSVILSCFFITFLYFFKYKFIYFNWRLITLQYCIVLPYIDMTLPRVYMCSPSWAPLPPPSPSHPSGSSQCTSPEHPVSFIEPGLAIHFTYDNIHVTMPFSQIIPSSPSPTESKRLFTTSVSFAVSHTGLFLPYL